ncbi:hypothetical protein HBI56_128710 [Parastagonospora nodorum]|uniref:Uncharacterized protein n=1 Tax=Phaeosphaeria nodorum (strain SN15 / ATCC MYA-4574 / FGSC 10173) TaxID=321614 RepID=A0A7U2I125_PHANO|nr:hypothetical protein HBH56_155190 [Parastagonospora nodorum]QRC95881.1 hypothetical protein JI435_432860 [Parastagonospora nodorum SN15]KAH3926541.1 hypothetical protein HBH54_162510 [Parastagonospora nodorum]KAH4029363.1 hypothetical protein HBI09_132310 [Parastagonospora nodorum]KAH4047742.1 hypothetical protein HBH49_169140 [Parastagonospora nodorum]
MAQAQHVKVDCADQLLSFLHVLVQLADPLLEGGHLGTLQPRTICQVQYQQRQLWPMIPGTQLKQKLRISIRLQLISANSQSSLHEDEVRGRKWFSDIHKCKVFATSKGRHKCLIARESEKHDVYLLVGQLRSCFVV